MRLRGGILFLLLSASWQLYAQEADTLAASTVYSVQLFPVVKPAEQVALTAVTAPPLQVADVLQRFTGVQVKDYGGVGGLKTVNVRSLGSEHVGIFLDGIPIENAQNMQVDLGRFSTDGIGMVSLYNGQKTRRLQTAREYASGAAVHLDTAVPWHLDGNGGRFRLRGGSLGTFNPSFQWDRQMGVVSLRLGGEYLTSSGRYKYACFDTTLVRENGDIRSLRLEAQLSGRMRNGDWRLHLYSYGSERGLPGPVIRRAAGFPFSAERQADQDLFVQGGWTQDWTGRYATSLKFKYVNSYTHYNTHPEKNPMALPYDLHYRQQSGYLSLAQSYILADYWSVDLSTDIQYSGLESDVGQFVAPRRTTFTGALATRLAWRQFRAAAHLVYSGAWDRFDQAQAGGWSRENRYRDAWMPSLTVFYSPWRWLELDVVAKRSYRLPSFNDLYYSLMGNANLVPESATQVGGDMFVQLRRHHWTWSLRLSPYYNRVANKIVAIPTSSQFRWTMLNIGKVDVTGLDVKAEADYSKGRWSLGAVFRYTFQRALDHSTPGSQTWGNQIPYIPLHSGSISLSAAWEDWSLDWDTLLTGGRWSRTANTPDYYVAPWSTSDVSLSRMFLLTGWKGRHIIPELRAGITCRNLFDRSYQVVQGYPMPGIHGLLFIELNW